MCIQVGGRRRASWHAPDQRCTLPTAVQNTAVTGGCLLDYILQCCALLMTAHYSAPSARRTALLATPALSLLAPAMESPAAPTLAAHQAPAPPTDVAAPPVRGCFRQRTTPLR